MRKNIKQIGFTLIELLVVIAIIGILITIVGLNYAEARSQARDVRRMEDMRDIQTAFEQYFAEKSEYPINPNEGDAFEGPIPTDPDPDKDYIWGTASNTKYCICSSLLESKIGNSNNNACNWNSPGTYFCVTNQQ